jgi:hypothetical protein
MSAEADLARKMDQKNRTPSLVVGLWSLAKTLDAARVANDDQGRTTPYYLL